MNSSVCVGPGLKSRRPVFSRRGSNYTTPVSLFVDEMIRLTSVTSLEVHKHSNQIQPIRNQLRGARWPSGRVSDSGARGRGFNTYLRRVVSLNKDTYTQEAVASSRHD